MAVTIQWILFGWFVRHNTMSEWGCESVNDLVDAVVEGL